MFFNRSISKQTGKHLCHGIQLGNKKVQIIDTKNSLAEFQGKYME